MTSQEPEMPINHGEDDKTERKRQLKLAHSPSRPSIRNVAEHKGMRPNDMAGTKRNRVSVSRNRGAPQATI